MSIPSAASVPAITARDLAPSDSAAAAGPLNAATWHEHPLYGGAITIAMPNRFTDCSAFRHIPDHQEVWADGDTDQSIIIELNSYDEEVTDQQAATHYQTELGVANDAISNEFLSVGAITPEQMPGLSAEFPKTFCISSQRISKFKDSSDKANVVQIYMAVIRLKHVTTDLLISFNVPLAFGHGSSSEGRTIMDAEENIAVITGVLKTIQIRDWGLFGQ